ncbi:hypothetical protein ACFYNA_15430 [Streptomyces sp. NPDC006640]|uniref:hypothetical protein n=1 Tax=Streptomyces sp. NPDC006640 TaxID=3364754 RepID=UPI0036811979
MAEEPVPGPMGAESRRVTFPDGSSGIILLKAGLSQDEADLIAAQVWAELPDQTTPED